MRLSGHTLTDDEPLDSLAQLPHLTELRLTFWPWPVVNERLRHLVAQCRSIKRLTLQGAELDRPEPPRLLSSPLLAASLEELTFDSPSLYQGRAADGHNLSASALLALQQAFDQLTQLKHLSFLDLSIPLFPLLQHVVTRLPQLVSLQLLPTGLDVPLTPSQVSQLLQAAPKLQLIMSAQPPRHPAPTMPRL